MARFIHSRVIYSALFYVLLMTLVFTSKPSVMFERDPETGDYHLRPFGVGYDKTMFSFGVFTVVLAVMSFYLFCLIDLVFSAGK